MIATWYRSVVLLKIQFFFSINLYSWEWTGDPKYYLSSFNLSISFRGTTERYPTLLVLVSFAPCLVLIFINLF